MVCNRCNYFSFWTIFLPFYQPNSLKNQSEKKKKKKKMPEDIIILDMCAKKYDQMMMDGWTDEKSDI